MIYLDNLNCLFSYLDPFLNRNFREYLVLEVICIYSNSVLSKIDSDIVIRSCDCRVPNIDLKNNYFALVTFDATDETNCNLYVYRHHQFHNLVFLLTFSSFWKT